MSLLHLILSLIIALLLYNFLSQYIRAHQMFARLAFYERLSLLS